MPDLTVAQNIFIGREPRAAGFFLDDRALNRRARELLRSPRPPARPRRARRRLTVARQQMVEIAKALCFDARVLIMDEPTAALNDVEVDTLFGLIRRFRSPDTGVIYISHRMQELSQISDRITVLRDGRYIDTLDTADDRPSHQVISLMVGRELIGERPAAALRRVERRARAVGARPHHEAPAARRQLRRARGRDPRLRGARWARGAPRWRGRIVGADRKDGGRDRRARPRGADLEPGRCGAPRHRLPLRGPQAATASCSSAACATTSCSPRCRDFARRPRLRAGRVSRRRAATTSSKLRIKTPSTGQLVQNLSGGNQQKIVIAKWLAEGLRHPHLRRADPRHRRRREGRDLRAARRARRRGQGDHHDLLRAARDAADRRTGSP